MGYDKNEQFRLLAEEYREKPLRAEAQVQARRRDLCDRIPELAEVERVLSSYGPRIMETAMRHKGDTAARIAELQAECEEMRRRREELLAANGYPKDWFELHYECEKCRDTGYVGVRMCDCMRRRVLEINMACSGMANLLRAQNFENFSLDYYRVSDKTFTLMQSNLERARDYAEHFAEGADSLLFCGGTGLGKTHLSSAIANRVLEGGYDVFYNSAVGLISDYEQKRFGNGISTEGGDTDRYIDCDLLIIDDLGTEVVNQFTLSCLYFVVSTRLNLNKPTIISTNLSPADLRKTYSDRLVSRLLGEYQLFPFLGTDVRKQKLQEK